MYCSRVACEAVLSGERREASEPEPGVMPDCSDVSNRRCFLSASVELCLAMRARMDWIVDGAVVGTGISDMTASGIGGLCGTFATDAA